MHQVNLPRNNDKWSQPIPLFQGEGLFQWPQNVFPELFNEFVEELSKATETPIELACMTLLSAIATCVQKYLSVKIKPDYEEPLNLWTAVVLPPGSRKSKVYSIVTNPIRIWEKAQREQIEPKVKILESQKSTLEARLKGLRIEAAKPKNRERFNEFQKEIEGIEKIFQIYPILLSFGREM